jgi:pimeloyl-ACP methyl ester carboxylesterase
VIPGRPGQDERALEQREPRDRQGAGLGPGQARFHEALPEHGGRLAEIIPNARYAEIDDAYVLLPLDQPERVADHLTAFAHSLA